MIKYYKKENNVIIKSTQYEEVAKLWGTYETTDEKIIYGYDGKLYLESECPEKPHNMIILEQINELKLKLDDTDYKAIKYAEGWYSDSEYSEIKAQREAWREEIRELEAQIEPEQVDENNTSNGD